MALVGILVAAIVFMLMIAYALRPESGEGFYAVISTPSWQCFFTTATFLPLIIIAGVWRY